MLKRDVTVNFLNPAGKLFAGQPGMLKQLQHIKPPSKLALAYRSEAVQLQNNVRRMRNPIRWKFRMGEIPNDSEGGG